MQYKDVYHIPQIEVERNGTKRYYTLIYSPPDSAEGYFRYWPQKQNQELAKTDWISAFCSCNIAKKLYLIGSIFRHRDEIDMIGADMCHVIQANQGWIQSLVEKYFDDYEDGLCLRSGELFFDLLYGPYSSYGSIKEVSLQEDYPEGAESVFKKVFADGTVIRILDRKYTWEDFDEETFVASDRYNELIRDLDDFEELLK